MASIHRKTLLWTVIVAATLCAASWLTWRVVDTSRMACDPKYPIDSMRAALWNPFRDRTPETVASLVMKARVSGNCQAISSIQTYCSDKEPIEAWRVTGESKDNNKAWVRIWVDAQKHDGRYGDNALYIALQKQGNDWKVLSTDWSDACGY